MAEPTNLKALFISTGEASGDAIGAALIEKLSEIAPDDFAIAAIGGAKIQETRYRHQAPIQVADSSSWGAISIVQSLKLVPKALAAFWGARSTLEAMAELHGTGVFVPIDFGFFNMKLAKKAKQMGWKVLYFMPPGSWQRGRPKSKLSGIADIIVGPFPWNANDYASIGIDCRYFGHPLKELLAAGDELPERRAGIALLPGSRKHEIVEILPALAQIDFGDNPVTIALAPNLNLNRIKAAWKKLGGRDKGVEFVSGRTREVIAGAAAAVVCSGTATLECALLKTPMVVVYKVSAAMQAEARLVGFRMPEFISLPNIILRRRAVPELLQDGCTRATIGSELNGILGPSEHRIAQLEAFDEISDALGGTDAITKTAECVCEIAGVRR